jgi:uncharacterized protein RhaS with RHS repeats
VYYRARYYEPTLGRFVSMDPAGMPDGVNRYAYVGNDPVGMVDPSGMVATVRLWNTEADASAYMTNGTRSEAPRGGFSGGAQRLPANQGQQANAWGAQEFVNNVGDAVTGRQMPRVAGERTMSALEYAGLVGTTFAIATGPAALSALAAGGRWAFGATFAEKGARGLSSHGGTFSSTTNAAGGQVVTSTGKIAQNDFATYVDSGLYKGNVNMIREGLNKSWMMRAGSESWREPRHQTA